MKLFIELIKNMINANSLENLAESNNETIKNTLSELLDDFFETPVLNIILALICQIVCIYATNYVDVSNPVINTLIGNILGWGFKTIIEWIISGIFEVIKTFIIWFCDFLTNAIEPLGPVFIKIYNFLESMWDIFSCCS